MPTIGLIVEGKYDKSALPILAARCRPNARFVTRECRGSVLGKIAGLVEDLSHNKPRIEKVLIVSDADGRDPQELERKFKRKIVRKYRFPVIPIIIVQELEAWLLADHGALKRIIGVEATFTNPEKLAHPKAELERVLPPGARYTSEMAGKIAGALDLKRLQQRCPRFSFFKNVVSDPKYRP
jgi:Domain of unknown function (DUF4276)